ncbi:hypothetical protein ACFXHA_37615 [Nocardia sp. NPDC059240]|uniref:hypothetical protein n=1 Tax=Nocardia sp. NPDC059240 TaxID=3346786 RepID=UPI0036AAAC67
MVWASGMPQPARLRPRRKARRGRFSAVHPAGVTEQPQQLARTDTGEFRPGDPQPAPSDGSERASKTWDWFVNATCWDWYENSSGPDRGDTDE